VRYLTLTRVPAPLELDAKANRASVFRVRQDPDVAGKDRWNQFVRYDAGGVAVAGQNLRTQHLSMERRSQWSDGTGIRDSAFIDAGMRMINEGPHRVASLSRALTRETSIFRWHDDTMALVARKCTVNAIKE